MGRSAMVAAVLIVAGLAVSCGPAAVDTQPVQRTAEAPPEPTRVGLVRVPYNPSLPYYVVTVEPFTFGADASTSTQQTPGTPYGWGPWGWGRLPDGPRAGSHDTLPAGASGQMGHAIANQLVTALGNAGNIRLLDYEYYWARRDRPATLLRRNAGEVGPFVISGSLTEFSEIAEAAGSRRTGSVALDLHIVDPTNGRVAATVNASGRFTTESAANGFSLFGFGKASNAFAASALGQANRVAMNSATQQVCERLGRLR
jgi:curli biogenesis system outer membrane secretion channel CsgG